MSFFISLMCIANVSISLCIATASAALIRGEVANNSKCTTDLSQYPNGNIQGEKKRENLIAVLCGQKLIHS